MKQPGVYVLHFHEPVKDDFIRMRSYGDSQHYVGTTKDLDLRISQHCSGKGTSVAVHQARSQHIDFEVGYAFPRSSAELEFIVTLSPRTYCIFCETPKRIPL